MPLTVRQKAVGDTTSVGTVMLGRQSRRAASSWEAARAGRKRRSRPLLRAKAAPAPGGQVDAERRQLTVMFFASVADRGHPMLVRSSGVSLSTSASISLSRLRRYTALKTQILQPRRYIHRVILGSQECKLVDDDSIDTRGNEPLSTLALTVARSLCGVVAQIPAPAS
jgi:hypothetical protein